MADIALDRLRTDTDDPTRAWTDADLDDPSIVPDIPGYSSKAMREYREAWPYFSPDERRDMLRMALQIIELQRLLAVSQERVLRERHARKNRKAVATLHSWRDDPSPDPDQVEAVEHLTQIFGSAEE